MVFALCDCNNFYVSCERTFNASLVKRPVVVLSNNDGCIVARSEEAKELGIKMGVPLFQVQHLIDYYDVKVFSSNYALYADMSQRVMSALQQFTPEVETYSIDEAFLSLEPLSNNRKARQTTSQTKSNPQTLTEFGWQIKHSVYKLTGIPLSIGLAETKTLSKLANHLAKRSQKARGVLDLSHSPFQELAMEQTPVEKIWGIGRQYTKLLHSKGILNAKQLRDADLSWVRRRMTVVGARIVQELRGISCLPLETCPPPKKSLTVSRSFGRTVGSLSKLKEAMAFFTIRAAERLRKHKRVASAITVFAATNRFDKNYYTNSATVEFAYPTDTTTELLECALCCVERIYRAGKQFRRAGVLLTGLAAASPLTVRMFEDARWQRERKLMQVIDEINARLGQDTIRFGSIGQEQRWRTKFKRRSSRYTTNWRELMTIA
jgi:DNA polymerase V